MFAPSYSCKKCLYLFLFRIYFHGSDNDNENRLIGSLVLVQLATRRVSIYTAVRYIFLANKWKSRFPTRDAFYGRHVCTTIKRAAINGVRKQKNKSQKPIPDDRVNKINKWRLRKPFRTRIRVKLYVNFLDRRERFPRVMDLVRFCDTTNKNDTPP